MSGDLVISPFKVAFDSKDRMVVTNNPYFTANNLPFAYLAPDADAEPMFILGDTQGYPNAFFDAQDNLYILDFDCSRLLIYRKPLQPF